MSEPNGESLEQTAPDVSIDDVPVPGWPAQIAQQMAPMSAGMTPSRVPVNEDELAEFGGYVFQVGGRTASRDECIAVARLLITRYLFLAAVDAGMSLSAVPGEPITLWQNGERAEIVDDWEKVVRGEIPADWWRGAVDAAGLRATVREVAAAEAQAPSPPAAPAAPVVTAPAGDAPVIQIVPPGGKKRTLTIQGPIVWWDTWSVHADEVLTFRYTVLGKYLELVLVTARGEFEVKLRFAETKREQMPQLQAWRALLDWCNAYVVPPLVDGLVEQVRVTGAAHVGGLQFSVAGIDTATGRVPWSQYVGSEFADGEVVLRARSQHPLGHEPFAKVSTNKPGAPLIPELTRALRKIAPA